MAGRSSREIEARKGERRAVALPPTGPAGISVDALVGGRCAPGSRRWRPLSRAQGAAAVSLAQRQKLHPAWAHGTWFPTRLGLWWATRFALLSRPPRALPGEGAHPRIPILSARLVHDIKARTMETRVRRERFLWGFHPGVGHNLHVFAGKKDGRGTVSQLLARGSRCEHSHRSFQPDVQCSRTPLESFRLDLHCFEPVVLASTLDEDSWKKRRSSQLAPGVWSHLGCCAAVPSTSGRS